ncbi:MAG: hypothetical protein KIS76_05880 [Pyrinomonadaceae bacterium]|nr:hypothetical protein [Pyrinomonadaceae bacterium]
MLKKFFLTFLISFGIGSGAILLVASSDNGYVAGFVFLPLFILISFLSLLSVVVGFILLVKNNKLAPWILLLGVLVPTSFISAGSAAKYFEIGAYREEPMVPFYERVDNVVIFKEGATNEEISEFWNKVLSNERKDGRGFESLPGLQTKTTIRSRNGREAMAFGFFQNATDEQKHFIFDRVRSSPVVYQLLVNQSITEWNKNSETSSSSTNQNAPLGIDSSNSLQNAR